MSCDMLIILLYCITIQVSSVINMAPAIFRNELATLLVFELSSLVKMDKWINVFRINVFI